MTSFAREERDKRAGKDLITEKSDGSEYEGK